MFLGFSFLIQIRIGCVSLYMHTTWVCGCVILVVKQLKGSNFRISVGYTTVHPNHPTRGRSLSEWVVRLSAAVRTQEENPAALQSLLSRSLTLAWWKLVYRYGRMASDVSLDAATVTLRLSFWIFCLCSCDACNKYLEESLSFWKLNECVWSRSTVCRRLLTLIISLRKKGVLAWFKVEFIMN